MKCFFLQREAFIVCCVVMHGCLCFFFERSNAPYLTDLYGGENFDNCLLQPANKRRRHQNPENLHSHNAHPVWNKFDSQH
jgi:hypothetical protein